MLSVGDPINYFTSPPSTVPSPAPGVVTADEGDGLYTVQLGPLANDGYQTEEHVGDRDADPARYIEARDEAGFEPPVIDPPGDPVEL